MSAVRIAAQFDVGAAARHVGRDGDRAGHAGFRHDVGFLLVEAGVEHGELFARATRTRRFVEPIERPRIGEVDLFVALLFQVFGKQLGFLDRDRPDQRRLQALVGFFDLVQDRLIFLFRRTIDLVVLIVTDHRHVGRHFEDLEAVDVEELVRLGGGGAGHARELLVHAEVILESDRGERLVLRLDRLVFLRFERLVQSFRKPASRHHAPGELVDDDDLAVADDVVLVALEQFVRAQALVDVMDDRDVLHVVERFRFELVGLAQPLLHALHADLGEVDGALLLVDLVIGLFQLEDEGVDGIVEVGAVVERAGNDQRRARLVDQDRIDFVDNGEDVAALDHVFEPVFHVVAQVVEAQLVVGAIGHVAGVLLAPFVVVEPVHDDADRKAEEAVDLAHPFGVTAGEVIIDRDHVHAAAGKRIEINRQGGDQS